MSTPDQGPTTILPLLEPVVTRPGRIVTKIYPVPREQRFPDPSEDPAGAALPVADEESARITANYLQDRLGPPEINSNTVVHGGLETALAFPYPRFDRNGVRTVTGDRKLAKWWLRPRAAAALTALSALALNVQPIADGAAYGAEVAAHAMYRFFEPVQPTTITVSETAPGAPTIITIPVNASMVEKVGSTVGNSTTIRQFAANVAQAEAAGDSVTVELAAGTSDEWLKDSTISKTTPDNTILGESRDKAAEAQLRADMSDLHEPAPPTEYKEHEYVMSKTLTQEMEREAHVDGYDSLSAAVQAEDSGLPVKGKLGQRIKKFFTSVRGVNLIAHIKKLGPRKPETIDMPVQIPGHDNPPKPAPLHWKPMLVLPVPRTRRKYKEVPSRFGIGFLPMPLPKRVRTKDSEVWVRLRKDALINSRGVYGDPEYERHNRGHRTYLGPVPFALTRKAMHLGREGLYDSVLQANYQDRNGLNHTTRMLFIGHHPSPEAVERYGVMLQRITAANKRRFGKMISVVNVYPSKDAGTKHGDPSRIAVGIDNQMESNVFGITMEDLELIEMHAPDLDDPMKIDEIFDGIMGADFLTAHEAGHAITTKRGPTRVRRLRTHNVPNAYVRVGNRVQKRPMDWLLERWMRDLKPGRTAYAQTRFRAGLPSKHRPGKTVTKTIYGNDLRMRQAVRLQIKGTKFTRHSVTSADEHAAEAIAYGMTDIRAEVGHEFDISTPKPIRYEPDRWVQRRIAKLLGAKSGRAPLEIPGTDDITIKFIENAEDDELIRMIMQSAREHNVPEPDDMITVLVGVSRAVRRRRAQEKANA